MEKIGLIATGDEITTGDITNSNGQYFAQSITHAGLLTGTHITVPDEKDIIKDAIAYLLKDHNAIITIGGLGPTSDDLTRFALAEAIGTELLFNEDCWQHIVKRLTEKKLAIPESNRQQCLFPKGAKIIHNPLGTASACYLTHQQRHLFMMPGPPRECRPLFDEIVLPQLLSLFSQRLFRKTWVVSGLSEGTIAEKLDALVENTACQIGYRVNYPYLEIKLRSKNQASLNQIIEKIEPIIRPYFAS